MSGRRNLHILAMLFAAMVVCEVCRPAAADTHYFGADALGWDYEQYYSTIQTGDVDGDGKAELLVRSASGMQTYKFNSAGNSWDLVVSDSPPWSDAAGWYHEKYYSTIQTGDADGDGKAELLVRSAIGMQTYKFNSAGNSWDLVASGNPDWSDAGGWDHEEYYSTIQTGDVDGDGKAELLARSASGMQTYAFDANSNLWVNLSAEARELTVLTYNAHLFEDSSLECICRCAETQDKCTWSKYQYDDGDKDGGRCYNCAAFVRSSNADIVAVQEVWAYSFREWWTSVLKTGNPNYPYTYFLDVSCNCHSALSKVDEDLPTCIFACALLHMEDDHDWRLNTLGNGLILLSKWPLQDFNFIRFPAYDCGDPGTECWADKGVITATAIIGGAKIRLGISHALTGPDDYKSNWGKNYVPEAITTFNLGGNAYIFALETGGQAYLRMFEDYTGVDKRTGKQVHGAGWKHQYKGDWRGGHEVVTSFELGGHPYLFGLDEGSQAHLVRVNDDPSTGWTRIFRGDWDPGCETVVPFEMQGHPYLFSIYGPNEARIVRINDDPFSGWSQVCSHTWDSGHNAVVGFQLQGHPWLFSIYGQNEAHIIRINDDPNTGWTTHVVGYPDDFSLVTTFDIDGQPHLLVRDGANQAIILRVDNNLSPQLTEVCSQSPWFPGTTDLGFVAVKSFTMNGHPYLFGIRDCCSQHPAPCGQPLPGEAYIRRINDDPATGWEDMFQLEDIKIIRDATIVDEEGPPAIMMGDFNIHASKYPIMDQLFRKAGAIDAYIEVHGTAEGGETIDLKNNKLARIFCEDKPETSYDDCDVSDPRVYPTEMSIDRIDYVYFKPSGGGMRLIPTDAYVIRNWKYGADNMDLSDHYPLVVKFRLETGCKVHIKGDSDCDGFVDFPDLALLCSSWLSGPGSGVWDRACDISDPGDDFIDMKDFEEFARQWRTVAVHNVTGDKAYASIQTAIDDANDGDEIEVAPGTYYEAINFKGKAVYLHSTDGPEVTTINASGLNASVVICTSGEEADTILEGFTLTGGNGTYISSYRYGGGMCNQNSSPTVNHCVFTSNTVNTDGGGMYNKGSSPTVTDSVFSKNTANRNGGGMHNALNSNPTVTRCTFTGNRALSPDYGGGGMVNNNACNPTVTDCIFSDNTANRYAGGMFNIDNCSPTLTNCTFSGNSASSNGGGMVNVTGSSPTLTNCTFSGNTAAVHAGAMENAYNSSPVMTDCTFIDNVARDGNGGGMWNFSNSSPTVTNCIFSYNNAGQSGGGMDSDNSSPTVTNCTFIDNQAKYGGGMDNYNNSAPTVTNCTFSRNNSSVGGGGVCNSTSSSPKVTNCSFSGNQADSYGGGMYSYNSNPTVTNCILWGNTAPTGPQIHGGSPTITYSDIQGGPGGTGNMNLDPLFVDAVGGNLRLSSGSPCIDKGSNAAVPAGITTDLGGNPRISDGDGNGTATVDMGAYEFGLEP